MSHSVDDAAMMLRASPDMVRHLGMQNARRSHVTCPVLQTEVVAACHATPCPYHVDLPGSHNCALVYAGSQGDNFSTLDLSVLYRQPKSEIDTDVKRAMVALRTTLSENVDYDFVPLDGVCVCCESPIEDTPMVSAGLEYCSSRCVATLPPAKARACYLPK